MTGKNLVKHHKMVKHTQTIRRLLPTNCLSVFDQFVGMTLKGLMSHSKNVRSGSTCKGS